MRTAFFDTLLRMAADDRRIILIVGDLGFGVVTKFVEHLPDQFINAGVAEQNMTGLAAGMALSGKIVFTYSIANFPVLRCLEQIRNDVCYHDLNVKVVAVGGGTCYGSLGISHHATEDFAVLRAIPNLAIIAPGDPVEAREATRAVVEWKGPCYLRLGHVGEPVMHQGPIDFRIGKSIVVREGTDLTLISTGGLLSDVVEAGQILAGAGLSTRIVSMHTLKPLDIEAILTSARKTAAIFTVEEHAAIGGLGGAVAEVLAENLRRPILFRRFAIPDHFPTSLGDRGFMKKQNRLDSSGIAEQVLEVLGRESLPDGRTIEPSLRHGVLRTTPS